MEKNKILLICHLADSKCNGQAAKTKDTIDFLKASGFDVDVFNYGKLSAIQKIIESKKAIKHYDTFVLMPGGKRALFFYASLFTKYKKKNVHYVAIGGWVLGLIENKKYSKKFEMMKSFRGIYLQNNKSTLAFKRKGFRNVYNVSNFSSKKRLSSDLFLKKNMRYDLPINFSFCFFARVERTKGVLLACESIINACRANSDKHITLDIFGEIKDSSLAIELAQICEKNPQISIKGVLSGPDVIEVLSDYYCMVFPTFYKGEGTPHTIIESFMAGLPIIASDWAYNSEIISNYETGILSELSQDSLNQKVLWAINNPNELKRISQNAFKESNKYSPEKSLKPLIDNLILD